MALSQFAFFLPARRKGACAMPISERYMNIRSRLMSRLGLAAEFQRKNMIVSERWRARPKADAISRAGRFNSISESTGVKRTRTRASARTVLALNGRRPLTYGVWGRRSDGVLKFNRA